MTPNKHALGVLVVLFSLLVPAHGICEATGCIEGSGRVKSEPRQLGAFRAITVGGSFDVNVVCGKKQQVMVTADDNILPHIKTVVANNTLTIAASRSICTISALMVSVTVPDLVDLTIEDAADVTISAINNSRFSLYSKGAADITANGKTRLFQAELSDAAVLNAADLIAGDVQINAVGAVDAAVHAVDNLTAAVNGAGTVTYYGNPKKVTRKTSEAGEIVAADTDNDDL